MLTYPSSNKVEYGVDNRNIGAMNVLLDMSSVEATTMAVDHIPDHEGEIRFTPPLYRQRYTFTLDLINCDPTLRSVLDIGCGTCQLFTVGKYTSSHTELAVAIDIVRHEIDEACFRLKPLPVEYVIFRRQTPLHMYLLHGELNDLRKKDCHAYIILQAMRRRYAVVFIISMWSR